MVFLMDRGPLCTLGEDRPEVCSRVLPPAKMVSERRDMERECSPCATVKGGGDARARARGGGGGGERAKWSRSCTGEVDDGLGRRLVKKKERAKALSESGKTVDLHVGMHYDGRSTTMEIAVSCRTR